MGVCQGGQGRSHPTSRSALPLGVRFPFRVCSGLQAYDAACCLGRLVRPRARRRARGMTRRCCLRADGTRLAAEVVLVVGDSFYIKFPGAAYNTQSLQILRANKWFSY